MTNNKKNLWIMVSATSVLAIAVVVFIILGNQNPEPDLAHLDSIADLPRGLTSTGNPYLGREDAPVRMIIYEDLGCPNCRRFYQEVEPEIIRDFIAPGLVRIEIFSLAFVNASSLPAAEGAACALEQEKFWEFRDILFANQGQRAYNRQNLVEFAEELGMDRARFAECFDTARYAQQIVARSQSAFEFGITGTPTSEINGSRHVGVIPYETTADSGEGMREILEQAVAEVNP